MIAIPILVLLFGIIVLGFIIIRAWRNSFGKDDGIKRSSDFNRNNADNCSQSGNINQKHRPGEKIIADDEGEYVDFEEIK